MPLYVPLTSRVLWRRWALRHLQLIGSLFCRYAEARHRQIRAQHGGVSIPYFILSNRSLVQKISLSFSSLHLFLSHPLQPPKKGVLICGMESKCETLGVSPLWEILQPRDLQGHRRFLPYTSGKMSGVWFHNSCHWKHSPGQGSVPPLWNASVLACPCTLSS